MIPSFFRRTALPALAALLVLALPASAETAPNAAITGDTIVFGQYADQTGPNAPTGAAKFGLDAYLQSVNAAGGVDGKKLRLISYDDGYKPSQTVALVKKLVFEDGAFAIVGGIGTPTSNAVAPTLDELGVPLVAMSTGSPVFYDHLRAHVFPAWPLYTTDGKTMGSFVKSHFPGKKTGVIYQDDGFGKPILAAVQAILGNVETSAYAPGQLDFSDALLKFKNSGVDVIVFATIAAPAAQILNALPKLDYHPARVLTSSACGYREIFQTVANLEGTYCAAFLPTPDSKEPQWKSFVAAMARFEPGHPAEIYSAWGWLSGQVAVEGLRRIHGPVTREAYTKALEGITKFQTIGGELSYSHERHSGICCQSMWEAKRGHWIAVRGSTFNGEK
ncbi:MAG: ABC transporter substrate-binding protein [Candidatus Velthaea sp.]